MTYSIARTCGLHGNALRRLAFQDAQRGAPTPARVRPRPRFAAGANEHPVCTECGERLPPMTIEILTATDDTISSLAEMLVEAVAGGASVTFMHPLALGDARTFWEHAFAEATDGKRTILGARHDGDIDGTVTLLLDTPANQRHRAEIAKLIVRTRARGGGIAAALMRAAEVHAVACGRTLLSLDTAVDGGAAGLYEKLGYTRAGTIPDYARKPMGGLTGTVLFWKRIGGKNVPPA